MGEWVGGWRGSLTGLDGLAPAHVGAALAGPKGLGVGEEEGRGGGGGQEETSHGGGGFFRVCAVRCVSCCDERERVSGDSEGGGPGCAREQVAAWVVWWPARVVVGGGGREEGEGEMGLSRRATDTLLLALASPRPAKTRGPPRPWRASCPSHREQDTCVCRWVEAKREGGEGRDHIKGCQGQRETTRPPQEMFCTRLSLAFLHTTRL